MSKKEDDAKIVKAMVGLLVMIMILGMLFLPIWTCPNCEGVPIVRTFCDWCGGDGSCTGIELLKQEFFKKRRD